MTRMRSDSGTDSGRSRTLCTTEKSAVFAPMHKASVNPAVMVNALSLASRRRPTRRSLLIGVFDGEQPRTVRAFRIAGFQNVRIAGRKGRKDCDLRFLQFCNPAILQYFYSTRRAADGSTPAARRAGIRFASAETLRSTTAAPTHDTGSLAPIP